MFDRRRAITEIEIARDEMTMAEKIAEIRMSLEEKGEIRARDMFDAQVRGANSCWSFWHCSNWSKNSPFDCRKLKLSAKYYARRNRQISAMDEEER